MKKGPIAFSLSRIRSLVGYNLVWVAAPHPVH